MNLFLLETPHQLMNALEARQRFPAKDNAAAIVLLKSYTKASFSPLLEDFSWTHTSWMIRRPSSTVQSHDRFITATVKRLAACRSDYLLRRQVDALAESMRSVSRLFLGNYNVGYMRHLAHRLADAEAVVLDDGTATLAIAKHRRESRFRDRLSFMDTERSRLREKWAGLYTRSLPKITFFTTYDLDVEAPDAVMKNDYAFFRKMAAKHEPLDEVFFLGQPMVEEGFIRRDLFFSELRRVKEHFKNDHLIYLPHKREEAEKVDAIERDLGFGIRRFDVPIEYQMAVRGTRPRVLASFFSSALENSRIIFGPLMPIKCFRLNADDFPTRRDYVSLIYSHYASKQGEHFEMIG